LIDAMTGANLWADRFEGDLGDIFALQDEVTVNVVSAIQPKLLQTEIDLAARRPNNLSAYDLCLRAQHLQSWTRGGSAESLRLASRALEIDPRYGFAATLAAECHIRNARQGWAADPKLEIAEGFRLLRLALSIDGNATLALSMLGRATASFSADFDTAKEMVDRAVALNPNSFRAWEERGWTHLTVGQPEEAIRSFERRIRLSPFDPLLFATYAGMSVAFIGLGRFDEAVSAARKAVRLNPLFAFTYRCLASALAHLERDAEAREAVAGLLELDPDFRISERVARGDVLGLRLYIDGLRKARVPE
jgi:adenylate cyclase